MKVVASVFLVVELIETLWNVNESISQTDRLFKYELIETLWNVNKLHIVSQFILIIELIETLWNVNF